MPTSTTTKTAAPVEPFVFKSAKALFEAPPEQVAYCVEGLLPTAGLSTLAGKPKAGKSTLARQLAVAVATGRPFLGRATEQGTVLYLAIEEKESEVTNHFQLLGLRDTDPIYVICGAVPKDQAVAKLEAALKANEGVKLVIIDTMFKFVGVRDANDYIQVDNALEKLKELARNHGAHILCVHHQKKVRTDDEMDGTLGSTAIAGASDTLLTLTVDNSRVRSLSTRQRYGRDMEPTQLIWHEETRELSLGQTAEDAARAAATATRKRIETEMIHYVAKNPGCMQQEY
jgi:RecA-family ATPase